MTLKWFFADRENETFSDLAVIFLQLAYQEKLFFVQPPHWQAEIVAVLSRETPDTIQNDIDALDNLTCYTIENNKHIYHLASRLSIEFNHHLFDTLYHAIALYHDIPLITADLKYYRKAHDKGCIIYLADLHIPTFR